MRRDEGEEQDGGDEEGWGDGDAPRRRHPPFSLRKDASISVSIRGKSWRLGQLEGTGTGGAVRAGTPQPHHTPSPLPSGRILPRLRGPNPELRPASPPPSPPLRRPGHPPKIIVSVPPSAPPPAPGADTHRLTVCWMTFIQLLRSSREAAWTSYISGGAALMRNIPFSWLAISRTMRFCSEMTAGLSCGTEEGGRDRGGGRDAVPLPALPPRGGAGCGGGGGTVPGGGASPAWGRCISGPSLAGR